jgi:hypothetical protein
VGEPRETQRDLAWRGQVGIGGFDGGGHSVAECDTTPGLLKDIVACRASPATRGHTRAWSGLARDMAAPHSQRTGWSRSGCGESPSRKRVLAVRSSSLSVSA